MNGITLYDTTLRDGTQREDINLSCDDKLTIAGKLDSLGIHYIEGGWPGSNSKDAEFFQRVRSLPLRHAKITAFSSTRHRDNHCDNDPILQALLKAETPVVTLFGKSWDFHVPLLGATLEQNLAMIGDSIANMKQHGKEVFFDAEHFFDGFKANPDYAVATLMAAAKSGADTLVLCETNGGCLPWEIDEIVRETQSRLQTVGFATPLGIHTHNDSDCAVANALAAVRAGCRQVQGTINGYGERVGNANLVSIIADLQLKMNHLIISPEQLQQLTPISRLVAEIANLPPNPQQPFSGRSAFAHKGGIHVSAILKDPDSYQHTDPALVGNEMRVLVSELSGRSNLVYQARDRGLQVSQQEAARALKEIKQREHEGLCFEAAGASVDLLLMRTRPHYQPLFKLIDFMVVVEHRNGRGLLAEAMVKVQVEGETYHTAAEGNGPVNALALALRKALSDRYPSLQHIQLSDYKVRILDSDKGSAATTRVLVTFHDGSDTWTTVGASPNIIEASWQAVSDSMEYALLKQTHPNDTSTHTAA